MGRFGAVWTKCDTNTPPGCCLSVAGRHFFIRLSAFQHLRHDFSESLRSLLLHAAGRMGIDVQRKARAAVARHGGHSLYIDAALQGRRGKTVPKVLKYCVYLQFARWR